MNSDLFNISFITLWWLTAALCFVITYICAVNEKKHLYLWIIAAAVSVSCALTTTITFSNYVQ